jgi:Prolyl oligopeptidase family
VTSSVRSWVGLRALGVAVALASGCASERAAPGPRDATTLTPPDDPLATLPDPLVLLDGRRVMSKEQWPERRAEILELFEKHVYGRASGAPEALAFSVIEENAAAMGGAATLRRVAIKSTQSGRAHSFEVVLFAPNGGRRSGVFLLLSNRPKRHTDPTRAERSEFWPAEAVIARGYAIAAIQNDELAPDDKATFASGVIRLFEGDATSPRAPDAWKMISAWSWGARRAMDYLVTEPLVDPERVAVIGHSRGGKAALWAGAQDERFSLTISNESGCAGAALHRRAVGENLALMNGVYPHWFADSLTAFNGNEEALPVDQHMLVSLLAPRGVVVGSASMDEWSDPEGEYLGLAHASPVFALWGSPPVVPEGWPAPGASLYVAPRGYHLRVGEHDLTRWDWEGYMNAADKLWPR